MTSLVVTVAVEGSPLVANNVFWVVCVYTNTQLDQPKNCIRAHRKAKGSSGFYTIGNFAAKMQKFNKIPHSAQASQIQLRLMW